MGMAVSVPRYTVDDLDHFPEDGIRYELLDGVLLKRSSSSTSRAIGSRRCATNASFLVLLTSHPPYAHDALERLRRRSGTS